MSVVGGDYKPLGQPCRLQVGDTAHMGVAAGRAEVASGGPILLLCEVFGRVCGSAEVDLTRCVEWSIDRRAYCPVVFDSSGAAVAVLRLSLSVAVPGSVPLPPYCAELRVDTSRVKSAPAAPSFLVYHLLDGTGVPVAECRLDVPPLDARSAASVAWFRGSGSVRLPCADAGPGRLLSLGVSLWERAPGAGVSRACVHPTVAHCRGAPRACGQIA